MPEIKTEKVFLNFATSVVAQGRYAGGIGKSLRNFNKNGSTSLHGWLLQRLGLQFGVEVEFSRWHCEILRKLHLRKQIFSWKRSEKYFSFVLLLWTKLRSKPPHANQNAANEFPQNHALPLPLLLKCKLSVHPPNNSKAWSYLFPSCLSSPWELRSERAAVASWFWEL